MTVVSSSSPQPIYFDNAATTAVSPSVAQAMQRVLLQDFGNPSSRHSIGLAAERQVRAAREAVAAAVGAGPAQVVFTSGGTEANALALLGSARRQGGRARHVLVSAIEHASMLSSALMLEREGFEVQQVPVTAGGWVAPEEVLRLVRDDTALVALMHVNNETGIVQPTAEVSRLVKQRNPRCRMVVDAVQSLPLYEVSCARLGADLITLSAHKVHGPKGVGCVVAAGEPSLAPLWGGGDQEQRLRPGTENTTGIVGFGAAVRELHRDEPRLAALTARLATAVQRARPDARVLGDPARRAGHIVAVEVPGLATEVLVNLLESLGVCVSSGSACHSSRSQQSHVAAAMGLPDHAGTVRFSLSQTTTEAEVQRAEALIAEALARL